jgi:hypothetical protein
MTRKRFFAALFGGSGAAVAVPAPVQLPDPAAVHAAAKRRRLEEEFRIVPLSRDGAGYVACDCERCVALFRQTDLDAQFIVVDLVTGVQRFMCAPCKDAFASAPHRLLSAHAGWMTRPVRAVFFEDPTEWVICEGKP